MNKILLSALGLLIVLAFFGCSEDSNPLPSKSHPADWNEASSVNFHGAKVLASGKVSCSGCHGYDLTGSESAPACQNCHALYPHSSHWMVISSDEFHGSYIAEDNWSMTGCKKCHGEDYTGGNAKVACTSCHTSQGGPESCSTCHGSLKNPAPPEDLQGHTSVSFLGVGAHQLHMDALKRCDDCHLVPEQVGDPGHIDQSAYAEVSAALAWNRGTGQCTTACHTDAGKGYIWNSF
jgi:hypothetical protein